MLRIVSHIENLLLNHDCVIVPGIGGFVTHFEEAFFSEDGSEIYPPYCSVSFNAHLSDKEDKYGMLAQSYMTAYDINYPKALSLVSDDVRELRELLRRNMELQIGTIGTLQLTLNYTLLFKPSEDCGIFAKELYGLVQNHICDAPALTWQATNKETTAPATTQTKTRQSFTGGRADNTADTAPASPRIIERDKDDTHYIIRVSKNAVRYTITTIAAALLYFVFTIAPSTAPLTDNGNRQNAAFVNMPAKTASAPKVMPISAPATQEAAKPAEKYTLVLASAVSEKGANMLVDEMKEDGFTQAKVIDDNGMTRVIYSSYSTEKDAANAAKELRQQHKRFHSAWVMKM